MGFSAPWAICGLASVRPRRHDMPMKMTATVPSSAAEVVSDPAAFLRALRADVHRFIELNRATLIDYWEYRIDTEGVRPQLVSI
jgi:hypothetical protein